VNGGGVALKQLISGGALALRQGRHADAVTLQARAASLCSEMELPHEQVLNLHILGGYLLAGQVRQRAREVYARAGDIAHKGGFTDLEAQSELALGMLEALEHRPAEAATHYSTAGRLAEQAQVSALAIECWRMAGQLAVEARLEQSAVECWKRALDLAEPLEPKVAQITSAAEIARALASLCRKRGLAAQAASLERQAIGIEQGAAPSAGAV
jgi:tetratricopeptide (TPR) repeat protein